MSEHMAQGSFVRWARKVPKPLVVLAVVAKKFRSIGEVDGSVAENRAPVVDDDVSDFVRL